MTHASPEFIAALKDASIVAPELPQADAFATLERLEEFEHLLLGIQPGRELVSWNYHLGTAKRIDDLGLFGDPASNLLVSADHATSPWSKKQNNGKGKYRTADHGTGSLAMLLAERDNVQSLVPLGWKGFDDVPNAPDTHPIKQAIGGLLPGKDGFMSLHGMLSGKLTDITADSRELQAIVGLGPHPNQLSRQVAEQIVARGKDLDLRVVIGNDTVYKIYDPQTHGYKLKDDGEVKTGQLFAHDDRMTTNYAYRVMEKTGVQIPSVQLELARLLLQVPSDIDAGWHVDRKSKAMGVHLGYLLGKATMEIMRSLPVPAAEVVE